MTNVTKTFLPPFEEYASILKIAWDKGWITNNGELVQELEKKLKDYLKVDNLLFTSNGTIVLQMALKAYNITGEVITTPFSYVATTNAIVWEKCKPVFVDITEDNFCIDADLIENSITKNTQAILATHVYGFACNGDKIGAIAKKHGLKVIYDGAHAFGCMYKGKSLLSYGDVSTCSFHATKLFHTVEGGCIISNEQDKARDLMLYRQFGHIYDDYFCMGINGKNSEFHAAMGLAVFPYVDQLIQLRKEKYELYCNMLKGLPVQTPTVNDPELRWNYSYFPVIFRSEEELVKIKNALAESGIFSRRYFYPSLNKLPFIKEAATCKVSEDIAQRVLSLPFYPDIETEVVEKVVGTIKKQLS